MVHNTSDLEKVWVLILEYVGKITGRGNVESLFANTRLLSVSKDAAVVSVPNQFLGDIFSGEYYPYFLDSVRYILGINLNQIQLIVQDVKEEWPSEQLDPIQDDTHHLPIGLNPLCTFSSFVIGAGSRFAYAASLRVSENPGSAYNPLFIYGDVGLGKTHLLSAIGHSVWNQNNALRVVYVTSEDFTNGVITSIRYQKMDEFRNKYRNIDVLLIDDIQFICGKERTQEVFFHTFNTLYNDGKQVVFSADRPAKELSGIDERLRSRFDMGLMADIQPPDLETKIAILYKKAEKEGVHLPQDVANFIARCTRSNVRELEGALIRLSAYSSLMGQEITLDSARHVLKDMTLPEKREIHINDIQKAVTEYFHLKSGEIKLKRRMKQIVLPRQIAMYLCRELAKASFPDIGLAFGGKDHSTVIHACKHITHEMEHNPKTKDDVHALTHILKVGER